MFVSLDEFDLFRCFFAILTFFVGINKYVNTDVNGQFLSEQYETPKSNEQIPKYLEIIHDASDLKPTITTYESPVSTPWYTGNSINSWQHSTNVQNNIENSSSLGRCSSDCNERTFSDASTTDDNRSIAQLTNYNDTILTVTLPNNDKDCTTNERMLIQPRANDIIDKQLLQKSYINSNLDNAILNCDGITSM